MSWQNGRNKVKVSSDKWIRFFSWILFIIYMIGISYFLFFSEKYGRTEGNEEYRYNLVLFQEITRFITYRKTIGFEGFIVNFLGNILAFAPFGFCLPLISPKDNKYWRVLLATFSFSFIVEAIQLIYKIGIFDVDDLFLNTIGGLVGYTIYRIGRFRINRRKKNKWGNR